jgi:hypothetical protein
MRSRNSKWHHFQKYNAQTLVTAFSVFNTSTERVRIVVTVSTRITEVLRSNLGWDTRYLDCGFPWVSSVSPGKFLAITSIGPRPVPSSSAVIPYFAVTEPRPPRPPRQCQRRTITRTKKHVLYLALTSASGEQNPFGQQTMWQKKLQFTE